MQIVNSVKEEPLLIVFIQSQHRNFVILGCSCQGGRSELCISCYGD